MADFVRSLRDAVLTVIDGTTPTANEVEVIVAEGDLEITTSQEVLEIKDRGNLFDVKRGDQMPIEWSFSARFQGFEGTAANVIEAMNQEGAASAYATTRATSDVFMFNLQFEVKGVDGNVDQTILLPDCFLLKQTVKEGDPNMVSFSGKSWATYPTVS